MAASQPDLYQDISGFLYGRCRLLLLPYHSKRQFIGYSNAPTFSSKTLLLKNTLIIDWFGEFIDVGFNIFSNT